MFKLRTAKNKLVLEDKETIVSGSVNIYRIRVIFDDEWDKAPMKYGVFKVGSDIEAIKLGDRGDCIIPWDLTSYERKNIVMYFGVYGMNEDGAIVIPTIWTDFGKIQEGVFWPSDVPRPESPDAYEILTEEIETKGDTILLEDGKIKLMSGDTELSSIEITGIIDEDVATDDDIRSLFGDE